MRKFKNIQRKGILYIIVSFSLLLAPLYSAGAKTDDNANKEDEPQTLKGTIDLDKKERKYIYDPVGKTDPFKSFIVIRSKESSEDESVPKPYLQTVELSQLSITVIVVGDSGKWAMVKDSKGDGYIIKEGTLIGTNGGIVHKIQAGEVIIREEFTNYKGETEVKDVSKKTPSVR